MKKHFSKLQPLSFFVVLTVTLLATISVNNVQAQDKDAVTKEGYAVVATPDVLDDQDWAKVVESLVEKRANEFDVVVIEWNDDALDKLRESFPKYACFVVKPEEATIDRLKTIWKMTRSLDDDPYGDVLWGIITGYDAKDATRLTQTQDCAVEKALGGTSIPLDYFASGVTFDEGKKNHRKVKEPGKETEDRNDAPDDTTKAIADALNDAQLFVTSGHASERNWSIGYSYKNGFFVAGKDGELIGRPSIGEPFKIDASGSKIHIAAGNCLWGNIDKRDCMALAMIRHANVDTFVGYVVTTWFGYMGWGVLDYYIEQPGRFTVAEAFFANNQALLNAIANSANEDAMYREGLAHDRDVVVLYGDPAWKNALKDQNSGWKQVLTSEKTDDGRTLWTLTLEPLRGEKSFSLVDGNGSQRGGRPFFQFFPTRVEDPKVVESDGLDVVVTDNFTLIPVRGKKLSVEKPIVVKISTK